MSDDDAAKHPADNPDGDDEAPDVPDYLAFVKKADAGGGEDGYGVGDAAKNISLAVWNPDLQMAEVTIRKGIFHRTMGYDRKSSYYLLPEEVIFLVERGSMVLKHRGLKVSSAAAAMASKPGEAHSPSAGAAPMREATADGWIDVNDVGSVPGMLLGALSLQETYNLLLGVRDCTLERYQPGEKGARKRIPLKVAVVEQSLLKFFDLTNDLMGLDQVSRRFYKSTKKKKKKKKKPARRPSASTAAPGDASTTPTVATGIPPTS
ncbi:hypothetical protein HDU96_008300 [Phlyctochytrium bullatum]|nr:hypothetical protein HDU96_008300 [Phlyctochytrium bullatum]